VHLTWIKNNGCRQLRVTLKDSSM